MRERAALDHLFLELFATDPEARQAFERHSAMHPTWLKIE